MRSRANDLLPLVYEELRALAQARVASLPPGQTIQATALVHDAYVRLVGTQDPGWDGVGHFFAAAARAMRRIVVDIARRKQSVKHGGCAVRLELDEGLLVVRGGEVDLLALDDALTRLAAEDARAAQIVELRYFAGRSLAETAAWLGVAERTVSNEWVWAKAWLRRALGPDAEGNQSGEATTKPGVLGEAAGRG
jgi:RNA polymerase sigma factor (TIGR02999 family)